MRVKTILKLTLAAVPIGLVALVLGMDGCYAGRVQRAIDAYHAAGEPVEAKDFRAAPIPDERNAALATLKLAKSSKDRSKKDDDLVTDLVAGYAISPEELASVRVIVRRDLPPEPELAAALAMPDVRWPWPLIAAYGSVSADPFTELRALGYTLDADARLAFADGDPARALRRISQIQRLAEIAGSDTALIGFLVSVGLDAMACDVALAGPDDLTADEAKPVIAELLDDARRNRLAVGAMQVERGNALFNSVTVATGVSAAKRPFMRAFFNRELPNLMRMQDLAARSATEDREPRRRALAAEIQAMGSGRGMLFSGIIGGGLYRWGEASMRVRTERRIAATLLALRAYRHDHGPLPAALDALVPAYLPAVPSDPYDPDAKALRWASTRGLVYSLGTNLKDDGGDLTIPPRSNSDDLWRAPDFGHTVSPPPPTTRPTEDDPG